MTRRDLPAYLHGPTCHRLINLNGRQDGQSDWLPAWQAQRCLPSPLSSPKIAHAAEGNSVHDSTTWADLGTDSMERGLLPDWTVSARPPSGTFS